jgi:hypothetical protein
MPSILNATTSTGFTVTPDNSGSLQLATNNGTTAVTIDTSQNVGIGTSSPARRLDVRGSLGMQVNEDGAGTKVISIRSDFAGVGPAINVTTNDPLLLLTNNTERMRITSNGYTKMSNDGTYQSSTGDYHEFRNTAQSTPTLWLSATNASYDSTVLQIRPTRNTTNNSFYAIQYFNIGASATKFQVADSGNVTNTNGSYGTISDAKLKENIVDATSKLDKLNQLKVRNFNFIGDDLKQIGFVAQEFEKVFPSMVEETSDIDGEGNNLGTTTKTIKTTVLVPILVKAMQELKAQLDESNLILTSVKTELNTVKAELASTNLSLADAKAELNTLKNPPVEGVA